MPEGLSQQQVGWGCFLAQLCRLLTERSVSTVELPRSPTPAPLWPRQPWPGPVVWTGALWSTSVCGVTPRGRRVWARFIPVLTDGATLPGDARWAWANGVYTVPHTQSKNRFPAPDEISGAEMNFLTFGNRRGKKTRWCPFDDLG